MPFDIIDKFVEIIVFMKRILIAICLAFVLSNCGSKKNSVQPAKNNQVIFIPSLHNFHRLNTNYSYGTLKAYIKKINPEIIAVEIRPEDIGFLKPKWLDLTGWAMTCQEKGFPMAIGRTCHISKNWNGNWQMIQPSR